MHSSRRKSRKNKTRSKRKNLKFRKMRGRGKGTLVSSYDEFFNLYSLFQSNKDEGIAVKFNNRLISSLETDYPEFFERYKKGERWKRILVSSYDEFFKLYSLCQSNKDKGIAVEYNNGLIDSLETDYPEFFERYKNDKITNTKMVRKIINTKRLRRIADKEPAHAVDIAADAESLNKRRAESVWTGKFVPGEYVVGL